KPAVTRNRNVTAGKLPIKSVWNLLDALARCDGMSTSRFVLMAESDYCYRTVSLALNAAKRLSLVTRPRRDVWILTDRGKIALAIRAGKELRNKDVTRKRLYREIARVEVAYEKLANRLRQLNSRLRAL